MWSHTVMSCFLSSAYCLRALPSVLLFCLKSRIGGAQAFPRGEGSPSCRAWPACVLSLFSRVQLCATLWTAACKAPPWDFPGKNTGEGGDSYSLAPH